MAEVRKTRPVAWIKAALNEFKTFPDRAQSDCLAALTIAAEGGKADIVKPMQGLGSGVFEVALAFRGDAFRSFTPFRRSQRKALKHRNMKLN